MTIPAPVSLGDGIHLIPAPLPFASPAWVNTYAVEAGDGLLLLDCGTDWEPGRQALSDGFRALGLDESSVHTLVVTHLHLDHVGMSARLVREWGCRFVMHRNAAKLVDRYNDTPGYVQRLLGIGTPFRSAPTHPRGPARPGRRHGPITCRSSIRPITPSMTATRSKSAMGALYRCCTPRVTSRPTSVFGTIEPGSCSPATTSCPGSRR